MPAAFAITAATTLVRLDAARKAEAAFAVTNTSGTPVRARASVVPTNPADATWLTPDGEAERQFAVNETHQFRVHIAPPATVAAGSHELRLDVVGVDDPDAAFTEGPSVSVEVPSTAPPTQSFPWWIIPVVLLAVIVVGAGAWYVLSREVEVPTVVGMSRSDAASALTNAGL